MIKMDNHWHEVNVVINHIPSTENRVQVIVLNQLTSTQENKWVWTFLWFYFHINNDMLIVNLSCFLIKLVFPPQIYLSAFVVGLVWFTEGKLQALTLTLWFNLFTNQIWPFPSYGFSHICFYFVLEEYESV